MNALAWDPNDDTFDPAIESVIADGATLIVDPSPYVREGYEKFGFTHVASTIPEQGDTTINLSFIFMPAADDPNKAIGGSTFLSTENAEALVEALEKGAGLSGVFEIYKIDWAGLWSLVYEEDKGMVFIQENNGQTARLVFSINAAKKLAGALRHEIGKVRAAD